MRVYVVGDFCTHNELYENKYVLNIITTHLIHTRKHLFPYSCPTTLSHHSSHSTTVLFDQQFLHAATGGVDLGELDSHYTVQIRYLRISHRVAVYRKIRWN